MTKIIKKISTQKQTYATRCFAGRKSYHYRRNIA